MRRRSSTYAQRVRSARASDDRASASRPCRLACRSGCGRCRCRAACDRRGWPASAWRAAPPAPPGSLPTRRWGAVSIAAMSERDGVAPGNSDRSARGQKAPSFRKVMSLNMMSPSGGAAKARPYLSQSDSREKPPSRRPTSRRANASAIAGWRGAAYKACRVIRRMIIAPSLFSSMGRRARHFTAAYLGRYVHCTNSQSLDCSAAWLRDHTDRAPRLRLLAGQCTLPRAWATVFRASAIVN